MTARQLSCLAHNGQRAALTRVGEQLLQLGPIHAPAVAVRAIAVVEADTTTAHHGVADYVLLGMRAITLISKSKPASQFTPIAVQFG